MVPKANFTFTRRLPDGTEVSRNVPLIELKTRHVCGQCNNTWGSDLEGRAKDAIEGIILKQPSITLSDTHCKAITDLAFKSTVLANHMSLSQGRPFFSASERRNFATHRTIPSGVQVWIAMRGTQYLHATFLSAYGKLDRTKLEFGLETYTCTFGVGFFLVQLLATRWTDRVRRNVYPAPAITPQDGVLDNDLIPIFPNLRSVNWPPLGVVGDHQMDWFWQRFSNKVRVPTFWLAD